MAKLEIIINRCARHLRGRSALRDAIVSAAGAGARVHETGSLAELEAAAADIATRGDARVVLAGGDGSYMAGVTALRRAFGERPLPVLALAPGGTVSTVARNWGMRGAREGYAARVVRAAADSATIVARPTLHVKDAAGGDRVGFIFGAGLVSSFFDEYYASSQQGYAGAARIVARIFAGSFVGGALARRVLAPTPCVLSIDGEARPAPAWTLIAASVIKDLGLHMRVTYRGGDDAGRFHAVASALPPGALGPQMPRVLMGRRLRGKDHVDTLASELAVAFTGERGSYVLDGEPIQARAVTVTPGPRIQVISA